ncbi:MAG: DUF4124 domain-containing protein [Xanthomonadales bacterium]|nr:DUF4124 domain-containing protein [Xanthomonadales bacterium]
MNAVCNFRKCVTIRLITAFCAALLSATAALAATEVYRWTDENGVVHFVDTPPGDTETQRLEIDEAYRPGTTGAYPAPGDTTTGDGDAPASLADQRREKIKEAHEKRRTEAAERERLCALHRQRLQQVEPVRRVLYTDENGDTVRMDDDERMALVEESKNYLSRNCD